MSGRSAWRAVLAAWVCGVALAGCVYGYSRDALERGRDLPPPRGAVGLGYEAYWATSPWYLSFSYTYGYPYASYYYSPVFPPSYYDWPYGPYRLYPYYYPYYPYYGPHVFVPSKPPRRTLRPDGGSGPATTEPPASGKGRRQLNLP